MKTISLKTFIETGKFGTIALGSTKSELMELLGTKFHFLDCGLTHILKYESWEFSYHTDGEIIYGIVNDYLQELQVNNKTIEIDPWFIKKCGLPTFKEVKQHLEQNQIAFQIENTPSFNHEDYIRITSSKVTLDFETSNGKQVDDFKLLGIRLYDRKVNV